MKALCMEGSVAGCKQEPAGPRALASRASPGGAGRAVRTVLEGKGAMSEPRIKIYEELCLEFKSIADAGYRIKAIPEAYPPLPPPWRHIP